MLLEFLEVDQPLVYRTFLRWLLKRAQLQAWGRGGVSPIRVESLSVHVVLRHGVRVTDELLIVSAMRCFFGVSVRRPIHNC